MSLSDEGSPFIVVDIGADYPVERCTRIKRTITADYGLTVADIDGPRGKKPIVLARHSAMAAVFVANPHWSLRQIGRRFGMRDHSTILWALRKMGVRR
jgi:chromosomal replication initiation ATPase DnaA